MFLFSKRLSFRISTTFVLNVLVHITVAQRQPVGPMSELTGTAAVIDKILSPGNPNQNATRFTSAPSRSSNSTIPPDKIDFDPSTCSVSFSANNTNYRDPKQKLARRALKSLSGDERTALFLTEAAENCVKSARARGETEGYPLGVVVCHSIGYVDIRKSAVGGQINVFRLGTVAQLEKLSGTEVNELESDAQLQLSFSSQNSPEDPADLPRSSSKGALRLSQLARAPTDDPSHLINPMNPHFTASYGDTEMVLVGSFHLNLLDHSPSITSRLRKRDVVERLSGWSLVGAKLVGRDTENLKPLLINLTQQPVKRSRLVESKPWGLFKRQNVAASSTAQFSPDSTCLHTKRFNSLISAPPDPSIIPPSPFLSAAANNGDPTFSPTILPFYHEENSILAASGRSERIFTTTFQLPGRSLLVLPIGLVIYAILSVITLMIVALVTFERIQYRNQFRSRKENERTSAPDTDSNISWPGRRWQGDSPA